MVDALGPAIEALREHLAAGEELEAALGAAAEAADAGARATTPMQARKGRASYLGERSVGHQDPGATSTALIVHALGRSLGSPG
jgi:dihydroxyacetone kinase-like protein